MIQSQPPAIHASILLLYILILILAQRIRKMVKVNANVSQLCVCSPRRTEPKYDSVTCSVFFSSWFVAYFLFR